MKTQKEYNQCQQPISCHNCSSNQICQAWVKFVKHHNDTKPYAHCNWTSTKGKHISAKELYSIYSRNDEKQTFIDYARKAKGILKLNDQEANALIKHHKRKIAMAIKEGQKK